MSAIMFPNRPSLAAEGMESARRIADWFVRNQFRGKSTDANWGTFPYSAEEPGGMISYANEWNLAFAAMGMLSAERCFGEERYGDCASAMLGYMKTLQILDPFHREHYGAIRENTAQTPWCYVRDSLSAAWGFLEAYRCGLGDEFLDRAVLWGEWFLSRGLDETGWPLWGVHFDAAPRGMALAEEGRDYHGCFHGGGLNFFYQLHKATGDGKWVGPFFEHIADYLCSNIQQADGFYRTVSARTGLLLPDDPQNGLHRANDDLNSLGLLCALKVYPKQAYREAVRKFLAAVFGKQCGDGFFEPSCASIPVVLNTCHEAGEDIGYAVSGAAAESAVRALFSRQFPESRGTLYAGGLNESGGGILVVRSMAYALIWLLKEFGGDDRFLSAAQ